MKDATDLATTLFINKEGEWRCVWRVLAFCALSFIILSLFLALFTTLAQLIPQVNIALTDVVEGEDIPAGRRLAALGLERSMSLASVLIASAICARKLEKRSFASTGYKLHRGWAGDFAAGSLLGAMTLALAVGIAVAASAMKFQSHSGGFTQTAFNFLALLVVFLIAAAFEEVLVRGFAFQAMLHNAGPVGAVAITSGVFALLHVGNSGATVFSTINTALAGVWLGVAYLKTRSLWLATALHYSWNLTMVFLFGLPVSGFDQFTPLAPFDGDPLPPTWLSGGGYGPEGGLVATIAMIVSTLVIAKGRLFNPSEEMIAALRHGSIYADPARIFPEDSHASR